MQPTQVFGCRIAAVLLSATLPIVFCGCTDLSQPANENGAPPANEGGAPQPPAPTAVTSNPGPSESEAAVADPVGSSAQAPPQTAPESPDPGRETLARLEQLGVRFGPSIPGQKRDSRQIRQLLLTDTRFTDADMDLLLTLPQLEHLDFSRLQITDQGVEKLAQLPHLKKLHLDGNPITDTGLSHLAGLTALEDLWLIGTNISDDGLAHLSGMNKLWRLSIEATGVTDAGLRHLEGLKNLRILFVGRSQVTPAGIARLRQALPECQVE